MSLGTPVDSRGKRAQVKGQPRRWVCSMREQPLQHHTPSECICGLCQWPPVLELVTVSSLPCSLAAQPMRSNQLGVAYAGDRASLRTEGHQTLEEKRCHSARSPQGPRGGRLQLYSEVQLEVSWALVCGCLLAHSRSCMVFGSCCEFTALSGLRLSKHSSGRRSARH